jgi:hypothetical protein
MLFVKYFYPIFLSLNALELAFFLYDLTGDLKKTKNRADSRVNEIILGHYPNN